MPSQVVVKGNTDGLDRMLKNVSSKLVAKIGIFGGGDREEGELSNVEVGASHEFGVFSKNLPRRSFLRDPISLKRKELIKKAESIIKDNIDKEGGDKRIFEIIAAYGEKIVQEAFETGGYGTWQPLSQGTINSKGSSQILIDSAQLRKSITRKVEKR